MHQIDITINLLLSSITTRVTMLHNQKRVDNGMSERRLERARDELPGFEERYGGNNDR